MIKIPLVSVTMTAYNHEKYVAEAIDSVLSQTFRDLELVIVNDGSADKTDEVIKKFKDSRIVYLSQENQGPSVAMNNAVLAARGKYIAHMSGDDVSYPNRIERQIEEYEKGGEIKLIFAHCDYIDEDGSASPGGLDQRDTFAQPNRTRHKWLNYFFMKGNYLNALTAFMEKRVLTELGLYNPVLLQAQDLDMWIKAATKFEFFIIPERLIKYRIRANSANLSAPSKSVLIRMFHEYQMILKNYLRISSEEELFRIFPDIRRKYEGKLGTELIPFAVAMAALENNFEPARKYAYQLFAINTLFEFMSNQEIAGLLKKRLNFGYSDLFKITGSTDILHNIMTGDSHLSDEIKNSYSWKITAPLRKIHSFVTGKSR